MCVHAKQTCGLWEGGGISVYQIYVIHREDGTCLAINTGGNLCYIQARRVHSLSDYSSSIFIRIL